MKFYQVCESSRLDNSKGWLWKDDIFEQGYVDLEEADDANPINWYVDYCNIQFADEIRAIDSMLKSGIDTLVAVKLYSSKEAYQNRESPIACYDAWESDLFEDLLNCID